jgi:hypothetical protein
MNRGRHEVPDHISHALFGIPKGPSVDVGGMRLVNKIYSYGDGDLFQILCPWPEAEAPWKFYFLKETHVGADAGHGHVNGDFQAFSLDAAALRLMLP